jgi:PAS domain S-box-containing protein
MPMVVTDARQADNPIVLANEAFLKLTGYSADEVIGRNCRFLQGPATAQEAVTSIRQAVAAESEICLELLNYRKNGTTFWNQLMLSPIHDDDGKLTHYFSSQMDVTERRRLSDLEQAERRLLREVDHRAMNVLALVQGIMRLTRAPTVAAYVAAVQGRVQVLAKAHTMLATEGWTQVLLLDLVETAVGADVGSSVLCSGPALPVCAAQVQPLAIVLHELLTNARRHGALTQAGGQVVLTWTAGPGADDVVLLWTENGGPAPTQGASYGYGFTMIDAIVNRQLRGAATRDWSPGGLNTQLRFPLTRPSVAA